MSNAEPPTTVPDPVERLRRFLGRALPVIALITFIALIALLINTVSAAQDAPTGTAETAVYLRRTFFAVLAIGLLFAVYAGGRGARPEPDAGAGTRSRPSSS